MSSMQKNNHSKCSSRELEILGDYWILNIIQILGDGEKRFTQLERELPKINPTTLTNRLKNLEKKKIINRSVKSLNKLSVVYRLSDKGKGILPVLRQIKIFANKFL